MALDRASDLGLSCEVPNVAGGCRKKDAMDISLSVAMSVSCEYLALRSQKSSSQKKLGP